MVDKSQSWFCIDHSYVYINAIGLVEPVYISQSYVYIHVIGLVENCVVFRDMDFSVAAQFKSLISTNIDMLSPVSKFAP